MHPDKRQKLELAGWKVGTAGELLGCLDVIAAYEAYEKDPDWETDIDIAWSLLDEMKAEIQRRRHEVKRLWEFRDRVLAAVIESQTFDELYNAVTDALDDCKKTDTPAC